MIGCLNHRRNRVGVKQINPAGYRRKPNDKRNNLLRLDFFPDTGVENMARIWHLGCFVFLCFDVVLEKVTRILKRSLAMDNNDYQQLWNECINKIYDPQPEDRDLTYRLVRFAKMKPEELKDLNTIIQDEDDEDAFEDHGQTIGELTLMRDELTKVIVGMEKAVEGSIEQQKEWHAEELEDPGESLRNEINAINGLNGFYRN